MNMDTRTNTMDGGRMGVKQVNGGVGAGRVKEKVTLALNVASTETVGQREEIIMVCIPVNHCSTFKCSFLHCSPYRASHPPKYFKILNIHFCVWHIVAIR